ncbi:hypothetical protein [Merismopedia glauca]|uniref:Uncharacterized protein n=1 Tax=Merismopedia glauca CCAP 1448/3 TaxID=1296344 RepID=A0A2T1C3B6_9CYAN|nr:hypothetical protein [Merismopedia glauca]PSB02765.1 hypothetical protein C7B64_11475 [Merismopedia glauca CCAP 1448/3]
MKKRFFCLICLVLTGIAWGKNPVLASDVTLECDAQNVCRPVGSDGQPVGSVSIGISTAEDILLDTANDGNPVGSGFNWQQVLKDYVTPIAVNLIAQKVFGDGQIANAAGVILTKELGKKLFPNSEDIAKSLKDNQQQIFGQDVNGIFGSGDVLGNLQISVDSAFRTGSLENLGLIGDGVGLKLATFQDSAQKIAKSAQEIQNKAQTTDNSHDLLGLIAQSQTGEIAVQVETASILRDTSFAIGMGTEIQNQQLKEFQAEQDFKQRREIQRIATNIQVPSFFLPENQPSPHPTSTP